MAEIWIPDPDEKVNSGQCKHKMNVNCAIGSKSQTFLAAFFDWY
jgi:hypothetical protein